MAINPNISLAVKPVEFADPLAMYGKIAAIQGAQNQNALAQYQLGAAQRAEAKDVARTNALAQAGADDDSIANALLKSGDLKGYSDFQKSRRETQKAEGDLVNQRMELSKQALSTVSTPEQYLAWHEANHRDPVLRKYFDSRGISAENARQQIMQELQKPGGFENLLRGSALGLDKAMEQHFVSQNLGGSTRTLAMPKYAVPGASTAAITVPGSEAKVTMSPYEAARIGQENQRLAQEATGVVYQEDANGNIVALPSRLKKGEVPTARVAVAPGSGMQPLTAKPSEAVGKEQMSINQQRAIVQGAIDAVKSTPDAFGWVTGNMPESVRSRMANSGENENRSFVFNVVSGVIKERAGTAQSAAEKATLERFLPVEGDNAKVIEDKMRGFQKYLDAKEKGTTKKRETPEKSAPVQITGDDDYNKLPSGTLFIGPDGQQRRKP